MTNRSLKKKIRQAFEHATPDLAESIAVGSLLSDNEPRKQDEKPTISDKPIKTPIQFRALATLAASIAVVALLANLISIANPFAPQGNPGGFSDTPQTGTDPDNDIHFYSDIAVTDATDPLNTEGPPYGVSPTIPQLSSSEALFTALTHAGLVKDDINDYYTKYKSDSAIPHWQVSLYLNNCEYEYEIEYRYGTVMKVEKTYKIGLIGNDSTISAVSLTDAINIATAEPLLDKSASINNSVLATEDGNSIYKIYFSTELYEYRVVVSAVAGAVAEVEMVNRNYYSGVDDDHFTTITPDIGVDNDMSQTGKEEALALALNHAGITRDMLLSYEIELDSSDQITHWDISFTVGQIEYEYEIELKTGVILKIEREILLEFSGDTNLTDTTVSNDAAIQIAKSDPFLTESIIAIVAQQKDADNKFVYSVRITGEYYLYQFEINVPYGVVIDLEIYNRGCYEITDDIDYVISSVPSYDIQSNLSIVRSHALKHAGLTEQEISGLEAELHKNEDIPHFEVRFSANNYVYTYDIATTTGYVLQASRSYVGEHPDAGDTPDNTDSAYRIAVDDPLVEADAIVMKVLESKPDETVNKTYFVYLTGQAYSYKLEVSVQYNLVYSIELANRNYYPVIDDTLSDSSSSTLVPPDGKIGTEIATNYALRLHDNAKAEDVQYLECSEGTDSDKYGSYYDVAFYHGGYKWHYYISMYSCELLGIDKIEIVYG